MRTIKESILGLVLAGGKGERLHPLTRERTKPSVPFGGKYRIIDFALSNFIRSGIYSIYVMVQYKSQSLIEHVRVNWGRTGLSSRHFITVVPPQMRKEEIREWYRGTADSVYQNINLIYDFKPQMVAVFSGDHVYRMDIRRMVEAHLKNQADLTLSVVPVPSEEAHHFGIVQFDDRKRVTAFREKPREQSGETVYASMGNYIFNADYLINILEKNAQESTSHDFGKDIIPLLIKGDDKVFAYDFSENRIPSLKNYEAKYYWKDVGTIKSYWEANMDLLGENPLLDLDNQDWAVHVSHLNCPPAYISDSQVIDSLISEGCRVSGAKIKNSILGRSVRVEKGAEIEDSIIMDFTQIKRGSKIKKAIIDRYNIISPKTSIGYNRARDEKEYFVDTSGIVVLARGSRKQYYW